MASTLADLKAALMECLKEFKAANYAVHLCNLLIKTQDLHEEIVDHAQSVDNLEQYRLQHERYTVGYIKEIGERGFADKIMGTILEALGAPKERLNEQTKQVSTFLSDSECAKEPSKYLKQLINFVESVVEVFFNADYLICYKDDLIGCEKRKLVLLKVCLDRPAKFISDQLLLEIFPCCLYPCDFSWNEKNEIVFAVIDGISLIQELTRVTSLHFYFRIDIAQLQRRSALQFLKELFAECLTEDEMLRKKTAELDTAIKCLDDDISKRIGIDIKKAEKCSEKEDYLETIDDFEEAAASFLPTKDDYLETFDDFEEAGACFVPTKHTWWQKYKDAYFS